MVHIFLIFILVNVFACSTTTQLTSVTIPPSSSSANLSASPGSSHRAATPVLPQDTSIILWVLAERVDCEGGEGPRKCWRVRTSEEHDWSLFYGEIEGFSAEDSLVYELRVQPKESPVGRMDTSRGKYQLMEILSRTKP